MIEEKQSQRTPFTTKMFSRLDLRCWNGRQIIPLPGSGYFSQNYARRRKNRSKAYLQRLCGKLRAFWHWPGNVRGARILLERAVHLSNDAAP